jgi:hypothetical protein
MIIENPKDKKELDKIPNVDKNGDPIYKIDDSSEESKKNQSDVGNVSNTADESKFKHTLQDLKPETSEE